MSGATLLLLVKIIDGIAFAVEHAPAMISAWRSHLGLIRTLIHEQREPTDAEWAKVDATAKEQTSVLRAVVDADAET